jgi:hypothetical protein
MEPLIIAFNMVGQITATVIVIAVLVRIVIQAIKLMIGNI